MDLKNLVASYATKGEKGIEINLKALAQNQDFRSQMVSAIVRKVKKQPHSCVLFPSYTSGDKNPLGNLINDLALTLQVETLVTGNIAKLKALHVPAENVIIIKQSFRAGKELRKQIEEIKKLGKVSVSVLCLIAHNGATVQAFMHENSVDVNVVIYTDEINYVG